MLLRTTAGVFSVIILLAGIGAAREQNVADVEKDWYRQYEKNLEITIKLERGKIVLIMKDLKDRKLTQPVILRFDEKEKLEAVIWAEVAELRYEPTGNAVQVDIRDARIQALGHVLTCERHVFSLQLPPRK